MQLFVEQLALNLNAYIKLYFISRVISWYAFPVKLDYPLSCPWLSKSVLMQHIFFVEASPQNGVEACYLTVSKLMVSPQNSIPEGFCQP